MRIFILLLLTFSTLFTGIIKYLFIFLFVQLSILKTSDDYKGKIRYLATVY